MNVQEQRSRIVKELSDHGWRPRDADPTDFQFGTDRSLRFKVGTAHKEVTVSRWAYDRQIMVQRASTPEQVTELLHWLGREINSKMERTRVEKEVYER